MADISISVDRGGTFCDMIAEFTDSNNERKRKVMKLLSVNPGSYSDAASEGVRRLLEDITGVEYPKGQKIPQTAPLKDVRLGTTVATNALLERKGCDVIFITTEGLEDVIEIGSQSRPNIFALEITKPTPLYSTIISAPERVIVVPNADTYNTLESHKEAFPDAEYVESNTTFEKVLILKRLDVAKITKDLKEMFKIKPNSSVAVALAHSYAFNQHEVEIANIAKQIGFRHVSISSELTSSVKLLSRAHTATADAYLTPILKEYVNGFMGGFEQDLLDKIDVKFMRSDGGLTDPKNFLGHCSLLSGPAGGYLAFSRASVIKDDEGDGNSIARAQEWVDIANTVQDRPIVLDRIPELSELLGINVPALSCDIGGTSTDCAFSDGNPDIIFHNIISGVDIVTPSLNVSTLASGGGSLLTFQNGLFNVGPESAGSFPGPACYNQTPVAPLAISDANCIVGKLNPKYFPSIFGPNQNEPLNKHAAVQKFEILAEKINSWRLKQYHNNKNNDSNNTNPPEPLSIEQIALGFLAVSYEQIGRGIRSLTESRGLDPRQMTLSMFGGAGPQSCCGIADNLSISTVHIHNLASILSAYGIHCASVVEEGQNTLNMYLNQGNCSTLVQLNKDLAKGTEEKLREVMGKKQEKNHGNIKTLYFVNLKYETTDTPLMVELTTDIMKKLESSSRDDQKNALEVVQELFFAQYRLEFGFLLQRPIIIESIRVRCESQNDMLSLTHPNREKKAPKQNDQFELFLGSQAHPSEGTWYKNVPLYNRVELEAGSIIPGPCYLIDKTTTIIVEPSWVAYILWDSVVLYKQQKPTENGPSEEKEKAATSNELNLKTSRFDQESTTLGFGEELIVHTPLDAVREYPCDPILLSLYQNRFMSITEQMCHVLVKTAASVNIKTRLDFSCALFTGSGALIQCAPNLPVHLGSLSTCVVAQIDYAKKNNIPWVQGDVVVTNDPRMGGSHLPDITVLTPLFLPQKEGDNSPLEPFLFFAARGHHADIGSVSAGSMPSNSQLLCQEGVIIPSFKIVQGRGADQIPFFDEAGLSKLFTTPGACGHPECVGTRNLSDNVNDLRAQIAANTRGIRLMKGLLEGHGVNKVMAYMLHIQSSAEHSSRDLLRSAAMLHYKNSMMEENGEAIKNIDESKIKLPSTVTLPTSIDYMDDGTAICLTVSINTQSGDAVFDFTGTGPHVLGNTNAPLSVVRSAVIYSLRTMIKSNIPLNQGILFPINIIIPQDTILSPAHHLGVVGGNVLTSQRITDVILYAFNAIANSYGCMNNFTFGINAQMAKVLNKSSFGYYETICGGIGATNNANGANALQCHMTNTQITDVEVFERKYPVLLRRFQVRTNSGGAGFRHGGNGVIREVQFLVNGVQVSILSERRSLAPNGILGGGNGARGQNFRVDYLTNGNDKHSYIYDLSDTDKQLASMGGKNTFLSTNRQGIRILTPGGGGFGRQPKNNPVVQDDDQSQLETVNRETTVVGSLAMFKYTQDTQ
jgi:5-oxoprolinase (ATP-hydrolysing)